MNAANTRMLPLPLESLQPQVPGGRDGAVGCTTAVHDSVTWEHLSKAKTPRCDFDSIQPRRLTNLVLVLAEEPITAHHTALVYLESFSLRQWP